MTTQEKNETEETKMQLQAPLKGLSVIAIQNAEENALSKWFFVSIFLHLAIALLLLITVFCVKFFKLDIHLFPKQKMPMKEIEFVLDSKAPLQSFPAPAQPSKTFYKPVPQKVAPAKPVPQRVSKPVHKALPVKKNWVMPTKHNPFKAKVAKSKSSNKKAQSVDIPDFDMPMPKLKSFSSGLGTSSKSKSHASGVDSSSTSIGGIDNALPANSASHSGGSKVATKKLIKPFDISPYISEIRRDIKANWRVPSPNKRVDLFLRIAKDGRVVILNVKRTSEVGSIDDAALSAVRKCTPFPALPVKYNKSYLDVVFVFDGTSVSARR